MDGNVTARIELSQELRSFRCSIARWMRQERYLEADKRPVLKLHLCTRPQKVSASRNFCSDRSHNLITTGTLTPLRIAVWSPGSTTTDSPPISPCSVTRSLHLSNAALTTHRAAPPFPSNRVLVDGFRKACEMALNKAQGSLHSNPMLGHGRLFDRLKFGKFQQ